MIVVSRRYNGPQSLFVEARFAITAWVDRHQQYVYSEHKPHDLHATKIRTALKKDGENEHLLLNSTSKPSF